MNFKENSLSPPEVRSIWISWLEGRGPSWGFPSDVLYPTARDIFSNILTQLQRRLWAIIPLKMSSAVRDETCEEILNFRPRSKSPDIQINWMNCRSLWAVRIKLERILTRVLQEKHYHGQSLSFIHPPSRNVGWKFKSFDHDTKITLGKAQNLILKL